MAAHDTYMAALRGGDGSGEVVALEDEIDRHNDEGRPIADAIVATRAVTLDGVMVKARALRWLYWEDPEEREAGDGATDDALMRSIAGDLWAMQGALA